MDLLHVGKYYFPYKGGIENSLRDLVRGQAAMGMDVEVHVHNHVPWKTSEFVKDEHISLKRFRIVGIWLYTPVSPALLLALPWRLVKRPPKFVHLHLPNPSALAALLSPRRTPLILHWHADIVPSRIDRRLPWFYQIFRPFERLLLKRATTVVVTSQAYLEHSEPLRDFREKCRVIPLGLDRSRMTCLDEERITHIRRQYGNRPLICSLGRLTYYKGYEYLIEAMAKKPDSILAEAVLVIVGEGARRPALEERIRTLGLGERVHLAGELEDDATHTLLAAADVFCLPSIERTEAFGVSLLEAMHYAKPLLTTIIPGSGVNHVNIHGKTGLSVPVADAGALAQALDKLLSDETLRAGYGQAAMERLEQHFTVERTLDALNELYGELQSSTR